MEENELYHYGVPGMKWGVRKKRELVGRKRKKKDKKKSIKLSKFVNKYTVSAALVAAGALFVKESLGKYDRYVSTAHKNLNALWDQIGDFTPAEWDKLTNSDKMIMKDPMTRWILMARHFMAYGTFKNFKEVHFLDEVGRGGNPMLDKLADELASR